jgi:hypothetical protein
VIVLDTNVLSELMKSRPSKAVLRWAGVQPSTRLFVTTITQAEILYGVRLLPAGKRRTGLEQAAAGLFLEDFDGRVLPFDGDAAIAFAPIAAERKRVGRPISAFDAQIAAIVSSRGATLATRNVSDFEHCSVELVNPWE